jgi:hypothetical protein
MTRSNKLIKGYDSVTGNWHCSICGINMGKDNSRQLCGKWYCPFENVEEYKD